MKKLIKWLKKWKLVDITKYTIDEYSYYPTLRFTLTPWQQEQSDKIRAEKGNIEYTFYPCGIGWGAKVKVWNTGEYIDITDVSVW